MSRLATTSGIGLGTAAALVIQKLGRPLIISGCGLQRYEYGVNRQVGGNPLQFTIDNGRVTEIYNAFGD